MPRPTDNSYSNNDGSSSFDWEAEELSALQENQVFSCRAESLSENSALSPSSDQSNQFQDLVETSPLSVQNDLANNQRKQELVLSYRLCEHMIRNWLNEGQEFSESLSGRFLNILSPNQSSPGQLSTLTRHFENFLAAWEAFAQTGNYRNSEEIFEWIRALSGPSAVTGLAVFEQMISSEYQSSSYSIGSSRHEVIQVILESEASFDGRSAQIRTAIENALIMEPEFFSSANSMIEILNESEPEIVEHLPEPAELFTNIRSLFPTNDPSIVFCAGAIRYAPKLFQGFQNLPLLTKTFIGSGILHGIGAGVWLSFEEPVLEAETNPSPEQPQSFWQQPLIELNENSEEDQQAEVDELVSEAQDRLSEFKVSGGITPSFSRLNRPVNYANFFIRAERALIEENEEMEEFYPGVEMLQNQLEGFLGQVENLPILSSPEAGWIDKLNGIRQFLFNNYTGLYARESTTLTDFVAFSSGDCEAQTILMIAVLERVQLELPPRYEFGIQTFNDHIQPVILDHETQGTINLVSGEIKDFIQEPIYRPLALLRAFLGHQQFREMDLVETPVSFADLVIAGRNRLNNLGFNLDLNSSSNTAALVFPPSISHSGLTSPNFSLSTFQSIDLNSSGELSLGNVNQTQDQENHTSNNTGRSNNEQPRHFQEARLKTNNFSRDRVFEISSFHGLDATSTTYYISFGDQDHVEHYNNLTSGSDRLSYLQEIAKQNFVESWIDSGKLIQITQFLQDPQSSFNHFSNEELRQIHNDIDSFFYSLLSINTFANYAFKILYSDRDEYALRSYPQSIEESDRFFSGFLIALFREYPVLRNFFSALLGFIQRIHQNPEQFLEWISHNNFAENEFFLEIYRLSQRFFHGSHMQFLKNRLATNQELLELFTDPERVQVTGLNQPSLTSDTSHSENLSYYRVRFNQENTANSDESLFENTQAPIQIPIETFIKMTDAFLDLGFEEAKIDILGRWTPAISEYISQNNPRMYQALLDNNDHLITKARHLVDPDLDLVTNPSLLVNQENINEIQRYWECISSEDFRQLLSTLNNGFLFEETRQFWEDLDVSDKPEFDYLIIINLYVPTDIAMLFQQIQREEEARLQ